MRKRRIIVAGVVVVAGIVGLTNYTTSAQSQPGADVKALYDRVDSFGRRTGNLVRNLVDNTQWVDGSAKLTYRKTVKGGFEFEVADIAAKTKAPAFDHAKLATALSSAASASYTAVTLPFQTFNYADDKSAIEFTIGGGGGAGGGRAGGGGRQGGAAPGAPTGVRYHCSITAYTCSRQSPAEAAAPQAGGGQGANGRQGAGGRQGGGANNVGTMGGSAFAAPVDDAKPQPGNGCWQAMINNYNVYLRPIPAATAPQACRGQQLTPFMLSMDGSEGEYYTYGSISWSPDGNKIAAVRTRPGYEREVHYVESSPTDQVQPKHTTINYQKPGDLRAMTVPVLFDVASKKPMPGDVSLFPNPYQNGRVQWRTDSSAVTFEYNQRGHQVFRILEINATTGKTRTIVEETSKGFIDYSAPAAGLSGGRTYRYDVNDGKEIIWMSERDGWAHLYLYDGATGQVKNQITKGEWAVHNVDRVDVPNRQIWFYANGMDAGKDPYFFHLFRVNFDGTGLTRFTTGDGTHTVTWSPDRSYYIDSYSRVNLAPVVEIRKTADQSLALDLEHGDMTDLVATGWSTPEPFVAKGRDGKTDIWGIIIKPTNFDPTKKYPVIENIYAGPQGSFVPKTFSTQGGMNGLAEFGFIVVQVDGMGTANRSRDFHEMSFKNIGDGGFPDRILWHKAIAAKYPWYDITRVGIYGTSAGGQNAADAVFTHPEFYKVSVSNSGCHDNRMDKIWWNEQWMSWPIGPEYVESSNVTHAANLKGKLQLVVGELDTNVDPSSTMQVVNALVKAAKEFELVVIPGANHGAASPITVRKRNDFFVKNLLALNPPNWNDMPVNTTAGDNAADDEPDYDWLENGRFLMPGVGVDGSIR